MLLGGVGVVARDDRDVEDLLERVLARLAGLDLDEVEDLVLAGEHEVVEAAQHGAALGERRARPGGLHVAGAGERRLDVLGRALRDAAEQPAVERLLDLHVLARTLGAHPRRERLELGGGDAAGRDPRGGGRAARLGGDLGRAHGRILPRRPLTRAARAATIARSPPCRTPAAASSRGPPASRAPPSPPPPCPRRPRSRARSARRSRSRRGRRCKLPDPPLREADYFGARRRGRAPAGPHLGRGGARLQRRRPRDRRDLQRGAADDPRGRRRARLRRPVAQRRAGAADRRAAVRVAAVLRRDDAARTRTRCSTRPGWVGDLGTFDSPMDKAIDPKVAEGLTAAWRARAVLGLGPELEARIAAAVDAVARGPFFRYPYVRLNQINWNAELYAHAATLTGNRRAAACDDYRRHVRRFVAGARRPLEPRLGAQPLAELPLPVPVGLRRLAQERRLGRVREHHAALHHLVRAGAARRDAPLPAADMRGPARLGGARAVRLLDAQRACSAGTAGWASSAG